MQHRRRFSLELVVQNRNCFCSISGIQIYLTYAKNLVSHLEHFASWPKKRHNTFGRCTLGGCFSLHQNRRNNSRYPHEQPIQSYCKFVERGKKTTTKTTTSCLIKQVHRCFGCVQLHLTTCQPLSCLQPVKWWLQLLRAQSCQLIEWTLRFLFHHYYTWSKTQDTIKRMCFGFSKFIVHEPGLLSAVEASLVYSTGSSSQDFPFIGFHV